MGGGTAAAASAVLAAVTFFNEICRASFPAIITQVDNTNVCMWMNNEIRIIRAVSGQVCFTFIHIELYISLILCSLTQLMMIHISAEVNKL